MTTPTEAMQALRQAYRQTLAGRITALKQQYEKSMLADGSIEEVKILHHQLHSLTGSAGTFGLLSISSAARKLEQQVKSIIDTPLDLADEGWRQLAEGLAQLEQRINEQLGQRDADSEVPMPAPQTDSNRQPMIYVIEDDPKQAEHTALVLREEGFQVSLFSDAHSFRAARALGACPDAILLDLILPEGESAGLELLAEIKAWEGCSPPVICTSVRDDYDARLSAFRAGANRYMLKPFEPSSLMDMLNALTGRQAKQPYRVMMVDDCSILLEAQSWVLQSAGIEVMALSEPSEILTAMDDFRPDVLILDVYMPKINGPDLAAIIRERDDYLTLPILFLSAETDLNQQMNALSHGGDDFLVKPVQPDLLVSAVKARAKRARQVLALQNRLHNSLYEREREHQALNQHAIVSVGDRAGNIIAVNDKFCDISGYQRSELIGKNHRIVKSKRHNAAFFEELWHTIANGDVWQGEICNLTKQGEEYWVKSTITPFINESGQVYQYVSIRTDITQVKRLELEQQARLFEQAERVKEWRCLNRIMQLLTDDSLEDHELLNLVVNSIPAGWRYPEDTCALIDLNGVNYATPGFVETQWCQYCSIELEQLKGQLIVCRIQPDPAEMNDAYGILLDEEQRLLDSIGLQIGQAFQRREAKRAMQIARQEAERANRAKSDFLASMSHELRTPLNSIIGFSQLLELSDLSDKQKKQLHTIGASGKHLLSLINDVLEFAKLESGKLALNIETVDVRPIIEQVIALSESHAYANNIKINLSPDTHKWQIKADPLRFKQVLLNLTSNAIKYNRPNGKLDINWHKLEQDNQAWWELQVKDTGLGIAEQDLPGLFEPFNRLGHEGSTIEGTGIGLSITQDLVEQMGGQITVESEVNVGTIFKVCFPLDQQATNSASSDSAASTQADADAGAQNASLAASTLKVLYVEDNPANMKLMAEIAQLMEGIELRIAPSAENGLQQAQAWLPSVILLDINLPGMNGDEAIAHFRAIPSYTPCQPTIYAVTANVLEDQVKHYRDCGFDDIIAKPFDIAQIMQRIEALKESA
ncbi:response regulator [Thiomicrospira microaerophila]|uniref:response regulator n=1 Tax=Thiomicrospira microaerophila TaxID=406020 RepID=UPI0006976EA4|nr:response regulator [Thiomicrospira microaerophila]